MNQARQNVRRRAERTAARLTREDHVANSPDCVVSEHGDIDSIRSHRKHRKEALAEFRAALTEARDTGCMLALIDEIVNEPDVMGDY